MLTDGSIACEAESSMVIDFACAAYAQIMVSARGKKKANRKRTVFTAWSSCR
jgi:hypothetical protein